MSAQIIEELPRSAGRYQFTHVLIQDTLAKQVSVSSRARLHGDIGRALEELYPTELEAHAAELSHHYGEARAVDGSEKLVQFSLLAGGQALANYAHEEALGYFQRGLAAKQGQATDSEIASLLFGLGRAQVATVPRHQIGEAVVTLSRAFEYYTEQRDVDRAVAVANFPITAAPGLLSGVTRLLSQAVELVASDSHDLGRLLSRYGRALGIEESNYDGAHEAMDQALRIARREGDSALEMSTLANAAQVDLYHEHFKECSENGLRSIELADRANDPYSELVARYMSGLAHLYEGDLQRSRHEANRMLAPAETMRDRYWLVSALSLSETLSISEGNWESAREFSDRGLSVAAEEPRLLFRRAIAEAEVGDKRRSDEFLDRMLVVLGLTTSGPSLVFSFAAFAVAYVSRIFGKFARYEVAEDAAAQVLASMVTTPMYSTNARASLGMMAVQKSDAATAASLYPTFVSLRGTMMAVGMVADRLMGLLSHTIGNWDQATEHYEEALAFCRRSGFRPELAWTCHDYAEALHQRNGAGDRAKAISLLDESLTISTQIGMRPLKERVTSLQGQIPSHPEGPSAYPNGLTEREVEVLRLVAMGKSNSEIGNELFISANTVANHVRNILTKTHTANRAAATAYAMQRGLTS